MTSASDPTGAIRKKAVSFPEVAKGSSCNQSSFKAGKGAFLYIGPGAKGQGFKAMFKLKRSMPHAKKLATKHPGRFEVGSTEILQVLGATSEAAILYEYQKPVAPVLVAQFNHLSGGLISEIRLVFDTAQVP